MVDEADSPHGGRKIIGILTKVSGIEGDKCHLRGLEKSGNRSVGIEGGGNKQDPREVVWVVFYASLGICPGVRGPWSWTELIYVFRMCLHIVCIQSC